MRATLAFSQLRKVLQFGSILILILVAASYNENNQSYQNLIAMEKRSTHMLKKVSETKLIIETLSSIHVPLLSGKLEGVQDDFARVERFLLISNLSIIFQRLIIDLISHPMIIFIELTLLIGLFSQRFKSASGIFLVIFLLLSPGLPLYLIGSHYITANMGYDAGKSAENKITDMWQNLHVEHGQLMRLHQQQSHIEQYKIEHENFFSSLKHHLMADTRRAEHAITGDFREIRTIAKSGTVEIIHEVIEYLIHTMLAVLLLPLGYLTLLYIGANKLLQSGDSVKVDLREEVKSGEEMDKKKINLDDQLEIGTSKKASQSISNTGEPTPNTKDTPEKITVPPKRSTIKKKAL